MHRVVRLTTDVVQIADLFFVHHRGTMNGAYMSCVMIGVRLSLNSLNQVNADDSIELLDSYGGWRSGYPAWLAVFLPDNGDFQRYSVIVFYFIV